MTDFRPCPLALLIVKSLRSSEKHIVFLAVFYKQLVQEKIDQNNLEIVPVSGFEIGYFMQL